jgi:hypothetical protein
MAKTWTIVFLLLAMFWQWFRFHLLHEEVTTSRLSPDDKRVVYLVDFFSNLHPVPYDRDFEIQLQEGGGQNAKVIYRSPDESWPAGSERFLWSKDGTRFILLGRHFVLEERHRLSTGEFLYFMYDVPSQKAWSNSDQQIALPHFSVADLAGYDFGEELQPAAPSKTSD